MIEIVTLFLGLVTGPQAVELQVGAPVGAVEVELDGELVEWLDGPPWRFEVDLGEALAPHELVAIAHDESGRELARARRWINIDMPRVEIDGQSPPGGLTPLPVVFTPDDVPLVDEMGGWFEIGGEPLAVGAVHAGPAEVVVVLHPDARPALEEMAWSFLIYELERLGARVKPPRADSPAWDPKLLRLPQAEFRARVAELFDLPPGTPRNRWTLGLWRAWQRLAGLGKETAVRFISPLAAPVSRSSRPRQLFAASSGVPDVGLFWLAEKVSPMGFSCRLADAVAVAGREAHAAGRRRAVVLLLDGEASDDSLLSAEAARGYLRALRVPLFTWTLSPEGTPPVWPHARFVGREGPRGRGAKRPGNVGDAFERLGAAASELRQELEGQRIVLLAGERLPHQISIAAPTGRARPAGIEPAAAREGPR